MRKRSNADVHIGKNLEVEKDLYVDGDLHVKFKSTFMIQMIAISFVSGAVGGFVYWLLMGMSDGR